MNFQQTSAIGRLGVEHIAKFLREQRRLTVTVAVEQGDEIMKSLQKFHGDMLVTGWRQYCHEPAFLEAKTERKHTGNFFLETWSNKEFGIQTPGWLLTSRSLLMVSYFLDSKQAYLLSLRRLQQWAFGCDPDKHPVIFSRYPEVEQRTHEQRNKTVGHIVPIEHIRKDRSIFLEQWDMRCVAPDEVTEQQKEIDISQGYVPVNSKQQNLLF